MFSVNDSGRSRQEHPTPTARDGPSPIRRVAPSCRPAGAAWDPRFRPSGAPGPRRDSACAGLWRSVGWSCRSRRWFSTATGSRTCSVGFAGATPVAKLPRRTTSAAARSAGPRPPTCSKAFSTPDTAGASPRCMRTTPPRRCRASPPRHAGIRRPAVDGRLPRGGRRHRGSHPLVLVRRVDQMVRVRDYDAQENPVGRRAGLAASGRGWIRAGHERAGVKGKGRRRRRR